MKTKIIIAIIYLSGYIVHYFDGRAYIKTWQNHTKEWTTADRAFVMTIGVGSWLSVITLEIVKATDKDNTKKANW